MSAAKADSYISLARFRGQKIFWARSPMIRKTSLWACRSNGGRKEDLSGYPWLRKAKKEARRRSCCATQRAGLGAAATGLSTSRRGEVAVEQPSRLAREQTRTGPRDKRAEREERASRRHHGRLRGYSRAYSHVGSHSAFHAHHHHFLQGLPCGSAKMRKVT